MDLEENTTGLTREEELEQQRLEIKRLKKIKEHNEFKASLNQHPFLLTYFIFWYYVFTAFFYVMFKYVWFGELKTLDSVYKIVILSLPFNIAMLTVPLTKGFRSRISRRGVYTFAAIVVIGIYPMFLLLQDFFQLF